MEPLHTLYKPIKLFKNKTVSNSTVLMTENIKQTDTSQVDYDQKSTMERLNKLSSQIAQLYSTDTSGIIGKNTESFPNVTKFNESDLISSSDSEEEISSGKDEEEIAIDNNALKFDGGDEYVDQSEPTSERNNIDSEPIENTIASSDLDIFNKEKKDWKKAMDELIAENKERKEKEKQQEIDFKKSPNHGVSPVLPKLNQSADSPSSSSRMRSPMRRMNETRPENIVGAYPLESSKPPLMDSPSPKIMKTDTIEKVLKRKKNEDNSKLVTPQSIKTTSDQVKSSEKRLAVVSNEDSTRYTFLLKLIIAVVMN